MATYTGKYNLKKPDPADFADVADINGNMDILDALLYQKRNSAYCVCETQKGSVTKIATAVGGNFKLIVGAAVDVKFTAENTASSITLNVDNTGAKEIKTSSNESVAPGMWPAGAIVRFVYNGTHWIMEGGMPDAIRENQKGVENGVATLDENKKIPVSQIPAGVGMLPQIDVYCVPGTEVKVSDGTLTYTKMGADHLLFDVPHFGNWTVTAIGKEYAVTIDTVKVYKVSAVSLSNLSWAKISEISENGTASAFLSVGDQKTVVIGGETLHVVIVGFNHDAKSDGSGNAGITFGLKNLTASKRAMNGTNTNAGGFIETEMYSWLNSSVSNFPTDLKSVIKPVDKRTSIGGKSKAVNENSMKVFLFSEVEVLGTTENSVAGEGSQYPYFATAANRKKYLANGSGAISIWSLRSPRPENETHFAGVSTGGASGYIRADEQQGVCFGFCV